MKTFKRKSIIATVVCFMLSGCLLTGCGGSSADMSKKELEQEALKYAEQDYGFKLTLDSCELVSHETASVTNPFTDDKRDMDVYGVLLKADANDQSGNTLESVKYEILVKVTGPDDTIVANAYRLEYSESDDSAKDTIAKDVQYNVE